MKYKIREQDNHTHLLYRYDELAIPRNGQPTNCELEFWFEIQQLRAALKRELGHCKRHNTFFDEEPCWQCVNEQVAKDLAKLEESTRD